MKKIEKLKNKIDIHIQELGGPGSGRRPGDGAGSGSGDSSGGGKAPFTISDDGRSSPEAWAVVDNINAERKKQANEAKNEKGGLTQGDINKKWGDDYGFVKVDNKVSDYVSKSDGLVVKAPDGSEITYKHIPKSSNSDIVSIERTEVYKNGKSEKRRIGGYNKKKKTISIERDGGGFNPNENLMASFLSGR
jgi:hypothetical protein